MRHSRWNYKCRGYEFKLIGNDGTQVIEDIAGIFDYYGIETEIIAASIRTPMHVLDCAKARAHISTVPYKVIMQMIKHPLTDVGIAKFTEDYNNMNQK